MWPPPSNSVEIPIPKLEYFKKGHWHPGWGGHTQWISIYTIHVWYVYLHLVNFHGKCVCKYIPVPWILWVYIVMTHGHLGRLRPPPSLQRSATRDPAPLRVATTIRMPQACLAAEGLTHLGTSDVTGAFGPTGRRCFCCFNGYLILNVAFYFKFIS